MDGALGRPEDVLTDRSTCVFAGERLCSLPGAARPRSENGPSEHDGSGGSQDLQPDIFQCLYITDKASAHCSGVW